MEDADREMTDGEGMIILLEALVSCESPSRDKAALDWLGGRLAENLSSLDASVELVPNDGGGDHVLARFPGSDSQRPALVLGHFDTVWPLGTLATMPFRVEEGRVYGPGAYDMKAGLAIFLFCMANGKFDPPPDRPTPRRSGRCSPRTRRSAARHPAA